MNLNKDTNHPTVKPTDTCRNYSSILAIASEHKNPTNFSCNSISKGDAYKELWLFFISKEVQVSHITIKIIRGYHSFIPIVIFFDGSAEKGKFPNYLKLENALRVSKKGAHTRKN